MKEAKQLNMCTHIYQNVYKRRNCFGKKNCQGYYSSPLGKRVRKKMGDCPCALENSDSSRNHSPTKADVCAVEQYMYLPPGHLPEINFNLATSQLVSSLS